MTFTREEIFEMAVDMNDDWQIDNGKGDCNVMMLVGEKTFRKVLAWFGKTEIEHYTADWWVDFYAHIDPKLRHVTEIYIHMDLNGDDESHPTELDIHLTNQPEMREIYLQLEKTGGDEFKEFIKECLKDLKGVK